MTKREKAIHWALAIIALFNAVTAVAMYAGGDAGSAAFSAALACFCILVSLWLMVAHRSGL